MKTEALYASVTQNIIAALEQGAAPWLKAWTSPAGGVLPVNAATGRRYSGVNILILWAQAVICGYPRSGWMTFKQALDKGACVRRGEKGTAVVLVKRVPGKELDEEGERKTYSLMRGFTVFNISQIDGLAPPPEPEPRPMLERYLAAEAFLAATGAIVVFGQRDPCYVPSKDEVHMPHREAFRGDEHYYATSLHEHVHWSGAEHRLNRSLKNRFGSKDYAAEELVAELGAAFLCAHLGIAGDLRHAGYIGHWLELLREDDRAIFTAAAKASQAADYLRSFSEQMEADDADSEA